MIGKQNEKDSKPNLKHLYGKFISSKIIEKTNNSDLEQEAVAAMKMGIIYHLLSFYTWIVSADLQSWVVNVLDNSINLDPIVLAQVAEMDEKAGDNGQKPKAPPIPDTDVSGFNVLLNACKPAILEARPPMKLNVVKDISKGDSIPQHASEKRQKNKPTGNPGLTTYISNYN